MLVVPRALLIFLLVLCSSSRADDIQTATEFGDDLPLQDSDLQEITTQVLKSNPELASSPGIKYSGAERGVRGSDDAWVVFYPHADSVGVKEALQVVCSRSASDQPWVCEEPKIRRYYRIENQAFEFRVIDDILGSEESIAVVEATRDNLPLHTNGGPTGPCVALTIMAAEVGYLVSWRCKDIGKNTIITMHATAISGVDITRPSNWQVSEYIVPRLD